MKRLLKKGIALLLSGVLLFQLCACDTAVFSNAVSAMDSHEMVLYSGSGVVAESDFSMGRTYNLPSYRLDENHSEEIVEIATDPTLRNALITSSGIYYQYQDDVDLEADRLNGTYISKYNGTQQLWNTFVPDFDTGSNVEVNGGIVTFGSNGDFVKSEPVIAKIDASGKLLWQQQLYNNFSDEWFGDVVENEDGSYTAITRGNFELLALTHFTADGQQTPVGYSKVADYGVGYAARIPQGYLVELSRRYDSALTLGAVSEKAEVVQTIRLGDGVYDYVLKDAIGNGDEVYLSCYAVPQVEGGQSSYIDRIRNILDSVDRWMEENESYEIPTEIFTALARENFTAVLIVCDSRTLQPKRYYSASGAVGGTLTVQNGRVNWNVERIAGLNYASGLNSQMYGYSEIYRYRFDKGVDTPQVERTYDYVAFGYM